MSRTMPLFEEPPPREAALSLLYSGPEYRVDAERKADSRWSALRTTAECDECFARQHETRGQYGHRFTARHQRKLGDKILKLCNAHAEMWRERDARDAEAGRRAR